MLKEEDIKAGKERVLPCWACTKLLKPTSFKTLMPMFSGLIFYTNASFDLSSQFSCSIMLF